MKGLSLSLEMARAWHAGRKIVTRRLMKMAAPPAGRRWHAPWHRGGGVWCFVAGFGQATVGLDVQTPYQPGEVVYIQEPFVCIAGGHFLILAPHTMIVYQASLAEQHLLGTSPGDIPVYNADEPETWVWRSPITMPEEFSRSWARIMDVRVERVQEITEQEAECEGFKAKWTCLNPTTGSYAVEQDALDYFISFWNSLHPGSWSRNDWVWRYGLEKVENEPM